VPALLVGLLLGPPPPGPVPGKTNNMLAAPVCSPADTNQTMRLLPLNDAQGRPRLQWGQEGRSV